MIGQIKLRETRILNPGFDEIVLKKWTEIRGPFSATKILYKHHPCTVNTNTLRPELKRMYLKILTDENDCLLEPIF